jgi:hypothetical protein
MACFGPNFPGETGHPLPGQTLEVVRPVARLAAAMKIDAGNLVAGLERVKGR